MTQMENRIVLCRFKDGYGPVGAYFLHLKTYTQNANGENYEKKWYDQTKELVGEYIDHHPTPTCLRNHDFSDKLELDGDQYILQLILWFDHTIFFHNSHHLHFEYKFLNEGNTHQQVHNHL